RRIAARVRAHRGGIRTVRSHRVRRRQLAGIGGNRRNYAGSTADRSVPLRQAMSGVSPCCSQWATYSAGMRRRVSASHSTMYLMSAARPCDSLTEPVQPEMSTCGNSGIETPGLTRIKAPALSFEDLLLAIAGAGYRAWRTLRLPQASRTF